MYQFNPYIEVITPLGKATAIGLTSSETDDTLWVTFIWSTGEPWWFKNQYIRMAPSISEGKPKPSPFIDVPPGLEKHIERYKKNGWL